VFFTLPILALISAKYNSNTITPLYPVIMRGVAGANIFQQNNSYLLNTGTTYFAKLTLNKVLTFETLSTNNSASYLLEYISQPIDISVSINPVLPDITMDSMAQFAFSQLLSKDQRAEESANAFKVFMQLSQPLVIL
jgi:hypothetical protein